MRLALFTMVVIGVGIGVAMPAPKPDVAPTAATAVAASDQAAATAVDTVLERSPGGHFYAVAQVNGEPIRFIVDTGASTIAFSLEDARRARIPFDPSRFEAVGKGASGVVRGEEITVDRIALDGKEATGLRGLVMEGSEMSLLGQNYLRRMNSVEIRGDTMTLR
jgi:aspartyl protease family protein